MAKRHITEQGHALLQPGRGKPDVVLPLAKGATSVRTTWRPDKGFEGKHYVYVYMKQTDGNQAWSSPIWVDVAPAK